MPGHFGRQPVLVVDQLTPDHREKPGARGIQVRWRGAHHLLDQRARAGRGAHQDTGEAVQRLHGVLEALGGANILWVVRVLAGADAGQDLQIAVRTIIVPCSGQRRPRHKAARNNASISGALAARGLVARQASFSVVLASWGTMSSVTPSSASPFGTPNSSPSLRNASASSRATSAAGLPSVRMPQAAASGTNRSGEVKTMSIMPWSSSTAFSSACGASSWPPSWWLIACVTPRMALVKAMPASSDPCAMARRDVVSLGLS